ncbi:MAG: hypothetical protein SGILL_001482 [Bacillariaceae sp.]
MRVTSTTMVYPQRETVDGVGDLPRLPGSTRITSSSRSTGEEDTQFSESSAQTLQTGTSSRLLINEGIAYHRKGQYEKALKAFILALKSQRVDTNVDHPFLGNTLANIGSTYLRQGKHLEAERSLQEAMQMMRRLRDRCETQEEKSSFKLSGVLNNLGTVNFLQGDRKASLEYYREALKDARTYGGSKKEITNALHNIGRLSVLHQDWDTAISVLNESLRMEKELYGKTAMPVVDTLNLIGFAHFSTEAYDAATVVFAEALSIVHSNCGLVHEKVATSLLNVGMVLERQDRLEEALHTFSTARDVFERIGLADTHRGADVAAASIAQIRAVLENDKEEEGSKPKLWTKKEGTKHQTPTQTKDQYAEYRDEPAHWQDDYSIVDSRDLDSSSS